MSDPLLARGFFAYKSDDSNTYQIGTTLANGAAQGAVPIAAGKHPSYPRGWKVRIVYGRDSSGNRTRLPIFDPGNGSWLIGGTFTKNAVSYTVEGKRGEDRFTKGG